jgi:hypothetical protein
LERVLKVLRYGHHEAIVVTVDETGRPHAAAMGVRAQGRGIAIFPYINTKTYRNIVRGSPISVAFTQDSTVFCRVVVEPQELRFREGRVRGVYILDDSVDLYVEAVPEALSNHGTRASVLLKVLDAYEGCGSLIAFSRANAMLVESLVYLTKLRALAEGSFSGDRNEVSGWLEVLRYSLSIVRKLGSGELIRCANAVMDELRRLGVVI